MKTDALGTSPLTACSWEVSEMGTKRGLTLQRSTAREHVELTCQFLKHQTRKQVTYIGLTCWQVEQAQQARKISSFYPPVVIPTPMRLTLAFHW